MIRDADFYRARWLKKKLRKVLRMRTFAFSQGRPRPPTTRWRWRRNRAEVRARTDEENLSIEVGLHGVAAVMATWPDAWEHVHYFWPKEKSFGGVDPSWRSVVIDRKPGCVCGVCEHDKNTVECVTCSPFTSAFWKVAIPFAGIALAGIFRRDVQ